MDIELSSELARLVQAGHVRDNDVESLRGLVWASEELGSDVIDALFLLHDSCEINSPVWNQFFIEAVEHFLLHQDAPHGYLAEGGAEWLRDRIAKEGRISSPCEMELLVTIIENAQNAPDRLKDFALSELEATILSGTGPTRRDANPRPNCVDEGDVILLRRLIFALGSDGGTIVGTSEADLLFRIKRHAYGASNSPNWKLLFVQGIGNHLLGHSNYRPLSRENAQKLVAEMDYTAPDLFAFLNRMIPTEMIGCGTIVEAFRAIFQPVSDPFVKSLTSIDVGTITADEAGWLKQHIATDGQTDEFEKALLTFLVEEAGALPSVLSATRRFA